MNGEIGRRLSEFTVKTKYEDIPKEVLEFVRGLTLKIVASMLAGADKPSGRKMAGIIKGKKLPQEVRIIGGGFRTALWEAVLLCSFFAHASELEDDHFNGGVFWDIAVMPLLFPVAEKYNLSGKAFMESAALGLEVHARTCSFNAEHLGLVVVPGAVGAAAGTARALGLGVKETAAALGMALSSAAISKENHGTDGHYFESALQSLQGMMAAEMAKFGLTGNPDIGTYLTNFLGKDKVVPEKMVEDLGKRWVLTGIGIKKYPCCWITHRQLDSMIELKKQHNLSSEDVETIEVHANLTDKLCDRPEPEDEMQLQFSFQHVLAAAMLDGDLNLKHFTKEAVTNPRLKSYRSKVKFIFDPNLPADLLKAPGKIVVKMKNGKEFSRAREFALGQPKEPLKKEQFLELYTKFTQDLLPKSNISKSADMIMNLESLKNVKKLIDVLV